ncbi:unnamed protein product [Amaranthus hypochondriacus]
MLARSRTMPIRLSNVSIDQADKIRQYLHVNTEAKVHKQPESIKTDLNNSKNLDDDGRLKRTGTIWMATSHIITAILGLGVLSLAWAIAQLGWILGPSAMILFSLVVLYTSNLLSQCYRCGDPITGPRNYTYMEAVKSILGGRKVTMCGCIQYMNLVGTAVGYTIAASVSMMAIKRSNCYHKSGGKNPCHMSGNVYMITFGIIEVIVSQLPDFNQVWWLSVVAALMSFTYSTIGLGLGIAQVAESRNFKGTMTGISIGTLTNAGIVTPTQKVWRSTQALGAIAYAYSFSMILIEIQDTIKSSAGEYQTMKKATLMGIATTTLFYLLCGCMGYAAFGDLAPGNLLTGFGFYNPYWLLDIANIAILIHLIGAYQVYCQPVFSFVEKWTAQKRSRSKFITEEYGINIPIIGGVYDFNFFRVIWRTIFVILITLVAMLLPFFNDVVGFLGAFGFWPLTVFFPIEMYIVQKKIGRWTSRWVGLQALSMGCLLVSVAACVGSIANVVIDLKTFKPFKTNY